MKHSVEIDYTDGTRTLILHADKVELFNIGGGVLYVIKGRTTFCYKLHMIKSYKITDEVEQE